MFIVAERLGMPVSEVARRVSGRELVLWAEYLKGRE